MEKLKRNKEKFLVDGAEIDGYVIDERNYATKSDPVRFVSITTNCKLDGVMVLYQLDDKTFTSDYSENETVNLGKLALNLKTLFFEYKHKLYIKSIFSKYNARKYFGTYAFDINYRNEEIFKSKNDSPYKKIKCIEVFFVKWLINNDYL